MRLIPDARFGSIQVDWRKVSLDQADDDAELATTPADVIAMLGFDPLDDVVQDEFNPDQPRDPDGKWTGLGSKFSIKGSVPKGVVSESNKKFITSKGLEKSAKELTGFTPDELTGIIGRGIPFKLMLADIDEVDAGQGVPRSVAFAWLIQDKAGNTAGEIERTWFEDKTVRHDLLELRDKYTGSGVGKTLLGNMMAAYEAHGVERVSVLASMVRGGYAWAKFGFHPSVNDWKAHAKEAVLDHLNSRDPSLAKLITDDPRSLWAVADAKGGRRALSESNWPGVLDLKDKEAMSRFYTYVNKPIQRVKKDGFIDADGLMDETDIMLAIIEEAEVVGDAGNPYHEPAGSEKGGQFARKPGISGGQSGAENMTEAELAKRMAEAEKIAKAIPSTENIDTPEREALRQRIADNLYNHQIDNRKRDREATIILGLPGAGKSTFANPLLADGALEIEGDLAKVQIPEFAGGIGAFAVHEEGSGITRRVLAKAMTNGDDIVWPRIDNPDRIREDIIDLRKAGYRVHVRFLDTEIEEAVKSASLRFVKTGRYVSPAHIRAYGDSPRRAAEAAIEAGVNSFEEHYRGPSGPFKQVR